MKLFVRKKNVILMKAYSKIVQFIRETYNINDGFIPLHSPIFIGNEKKYLNDCLETTFVSSVGEFVDKFENDIASFTGSKKAIACLNGTNALHIALLLVGVEYNDEVITQPLTFAATANAISYCGAHPVFVDVDKTTLGLSPESLEQFLHENTEQKYQTTYNRKTGRKISAVVPMHTFGHPCKIDEIVSICHQYNVPLVEDAAESLGSVFKQKHTGTFGKIGVLSFNGNKIITTGGGGMLLFNDEELAAKAKHLTTQAKVPHPWEIKHDKIGYNYRMPNINAALGVAQLEQMNNYLASKRRLAEAYKKFFAQMEIQFFEEPVNSLSNYWLNSILLNNREERDAFLKYTNNNGVMTRPVWELMNNLPMYVSYESDALVNANYISKRLVNLPSSPLIK